MSEFEEALRRERDLQGEVANTERLKQQRLEEIALLNKRSDGTLPSELLGDDTRLVIDFLNTMRAAGMPGAEGLRVGEKTTTRKGFLGRLIMETHPVYIRSYFIGLVGPEKFMSSYGGLPTLSNGIDTGKEVLRALQEESVNNSYRYQFKSMLNYSSHKTSELFICSDGLLRVKGYNSDFDKTFNVPVFESDTEFVPGQYAVLVKSDPDSFSGHSTETIFCALSLTRTLAIVANNNL